MEFFMFFLKEVPDVQKYVKFNRKNAKFNYRKLFENFSTTHPAQTARPLWHFLSPPAGHVLRLP